VTSFKRRDDAIEKDSYRHIWIYDLEGTSAGERSAFCEKSGLIKRWTRRGEGLPAPR